ncbi:MAG TPA: aspartyl protease family protein [Armatimonadota bacterium]|nr:aspartyl protease family protein [Armatimonadota bacterium]
MIDTGATSTCIDDAVAQQLGLPVIDVVNISSASHSSVSQNVCPAFIQLAGFFSVNAPRAIGAALAPPGLVALIGRDLLVACTLYYNGPDGSFTLSM